MAREIPSLRRYARSLTGDAPQADDLVQDCLERALRKRHLWSRRGSLRAWLFRILYREFLNGRRRKRETRAHLPIEEHEAAMMQPPTQLGQAHCRDVLVALESLPAEQRAAVTLIALEDFTYDEAARIMRIPVGTLRSRLARGRQGLRAMVEAEPERAADEETLDGSAEPVRLRRVK
jgi:RNA polymerase sigma-70 factor (ECF subfamily)